jgi:hypothetical protein
MKGLWSLPLLLLLLLPTLCWGTGSINTLNYNGRLVDPDGTPISGSVSLTFRLYIGSILTCAQTEFVDLTNTNGVFSVALDFDSGCTTPGTLFEALQLVESSSEELFIEIYDNTHAQTYPKQKISASPRALLAAYALEAPVVETASTAASLDQLGAIPGKFLRWDGAQWGPDDLVASGAGSGTIDSVTATSGLVTSIAGNGPITTSGTISADINPAYFQISAGVMEVRSGIIDDTLLGIGISGSKFVTGSVPMDRLDTTVCESDGTNCTLVVPSGLITYFNLASCPAGWSEVTDARGRYIVVMPNPGTPGAMVGTALANLENRTVAQHTHTATVSVEGNHAHTVTLANAGTHDHEPGSGNITETMPPHTISARAGAGIGNPKMNGDSGGTIPHTLATSAVANHTHTITLGSTGNHTHPVTISTAGGHTAGAVTIDNAGAVAGTNAPYIQLLVCEKL